MSGQKKCGRGRCITKRENYSLERTVKQNPFQNLGKLHKDWIEAEVGASRAKKQRRILDIGYKCRIPHVKLVLSQWHLTWAKVKRNWMLL